MQFTQWVAREAVERRGALQKVDELADFLHYLTTREAPRTIVEIGSEAGGTLWALHMLTTADLCSIDLPHVPNSTRRPLNLPNGTRLILGNSHDAQTRRTLKVWLGVREIDLLVIDGDHTFEGVLSDWRDYAPLVRDGGLVMLHDTLRHPRNPNVGVWRLWRYLRRRYEFAEFVGPPRDWGGIGVVVYHRDP